MSEDFEGHVLERYELLQKLGKGAYGVVYKARDRFTNAHVAVKKIYDAFQNSTDAQRTYREVMYLRKLTGHSNIIKLLSVIHANNKRDIYLVFELMESDLHIVIRAKILNIKHKRFIIYQLFKALKYLHSGKLVHRDLKPSNMLINSDCSMKLADFGLVRSILSEENGEVPIVSDYIATRWYRAPEILLGSQKYSMSVDIWSAGCIMAEILLEKVLFPGKDSLHQLEVIFELLGRPSQSNLTAMKIYSTTAVLETLAAEQKNSIEDLFSSFPQGAVDLLTRILSYDPAARPTAEQILAHPFFESLHSAAREPSLPRPITIPINDHSKLSLSEYRDALYKFSLSKNLKSLNTEPSNIIKKQNENKANLSPEMFKIRHNSKPKTFQSQNHIIQNSPKSNKENYAPQFAKAKSYMVLEARKPSSYGLSPTNKASLKNRNLISGSGSINPQYNPSLMNLIIPGAHKKPGNLYKNYSSKENSKLKSNLCISEKIAAFSVKNMKSYYASEK